MENDLLLPISNTVFTKKYFFVTIISYMLTISIYVSDSK